MVVEWLEVVKMEEKKINYIALVLVGLLLIFSVVQTVQIDNMKESIEDGEYAVSSGGGSSSYPTAPASAPTMVGGC